jgi:hypothetical protein
MAVLLLALAGCSSSPPPPPPAPAIKAPEDSRREPGGSLRAEDSVGSRAAAIYLWRVNLPTELPSFDAKKPWKLGPADYVKTAAGQDAWSLEYFIEPGSPERLSVVAIEHASDAAAREALASSFAGRGIERPADVPGGAARAVEGPGRTPGNARRVDSLAGVAVDRYLFLFDRGLEGAAAPAKLEDAPAIGGTTVRAFVNAVLPGKLGG